MGKAKGKAKLGVKVKGGAKGKAKLGVKVKGGAKAKAKAKGKAKVHVKVKAKPKVKAKAKVHVKAKVKAKKSRRLQATSATLGQSTSGLSLSSYKPNVKVSTKLTAGPGQTQPKGSTIQTAALLLISLIYVLFN